MRAGGMKSKVRPESRVSGADDMTGGEVSVLRVQPKARIGRKVFDTLTMPNGRRIKIMREDAFQAALAATREATRR